LLVIKKGDYYVKVTNSIPTLVTDVSKATSFKPGEAEKYIRNHVRKNQHDLYRIVSETPTNPIIVTNPKEHINSPKTTVINCLQEIKDSVSRKLSANQSEYYKELQYYDDAILDIRHYIRDKNTRLNVCSAAKVLYKLQTLERKRAEVKCEIQRIKQVFDVVDNAISGADDFEYLPYKPRVIQNMDEFMVGDSK
jgi:hypothetical protein